MPSTQNKLLHIASVLLAFYWSVAALGALFFLIQRLFMCEPSCSVSPLPNWTVILMAFTTEGLVIAWGVHMTLCSNREDESRTQTKDLCATMFIGAGSGAAAYVLYQLFRFGVEIAVDGFASFTR